jgi:hypothetical protein
VIDGYIYKYCKDMIFDDALRYEVDFIEFFDLATSTLSHRTAGEIDLMIWEVDAATSQNLYDVTLNTQDKKLIFDSPANLYPGRMQTVFLLNAMANSNKPSSVSNVENITWKELFAASLLSQAYMAKYVEVSGLFYDLPEYSDYFFDLSECIGHFAINCKEILGILSTMEGFKYILPRTAMNSKKTSQARQAAKARHHTTDSLKRKYCDWYMEASNRSGMGYAKAAEYFWINNLSDKEQKEITIGTLEKALRLHLKRL